MRSFSPKGFTLLETMVYIGIFSVVLPAFTIFVLHSWQQQIGFDARMRLEQSTSLIFLEVSNSLTEADAILVSTSTLATDTSILRFQDANGAAVVIDVSSTTVNFSGTNQTVRRLRLQRGSSTPVWLTEPEHDVTQWRVEVVRNTTNVLTGLRVSLDAQLLNTSGNVYRNATFAADTTFALSPHTIEL
ncbi:MAG: type II secretion system protein [Patescibacteria group bacterium]